MNGAERLGRALQFPRDVLDDVLADDKRWWGGHVVVELTGESGGTPYELADPPLELVIAVVASVLVDSETEVSDAPLLRADPQVGDEVVERASSARHQVCQLDVASGMRMQQRR